MASKDPLQQRAPTLPEFNDDEYWRDVLQLDENRTEESFDQQLAAEAAEYGIAMAPPPASKAHISVCDSTVTVESRHARTGSTGSQNSLSTTATSRTSSDGRKGHSRQAPSFSSYERFLDHAEPMPHLHPIPSEPAPSLFSVSTRKSYSSIKSGIKNKFRGLRRNKASAENLNSCICCRDDFKVIHNLHTLPCSHKYCEKCLRVMVQQAAVSEDKFPPKCCSRGIPGPIIKSVLAPNEQHVFMSAVQQYTTPWADRLFCPNAACGAFIPPRPKVNPKNPFTVTCAKCHSAACSICKSSAHQIGQDCPSDWELEAVLKMGENAGWRRCYKCRTLVELTQGCSHITCRCKAQFCYLCGAVWDPDIGCPNYCTGEEELERRRAEEESRAADLAAEKLIKEQEEAKAAAEAAVAKQRTENSMLLQALIGKHLLERDRFVGFERKMKWIMWTRHGQEKLDVLDRYGELQTQLLDKQAKTASQLEDRQVSAEMELRATLKQAERSVRIRLRHMEAYCDGLGRAPDAPGVRVVTERDLRELGQQYNVRDDLERLHTAKINVMREKQAKQMEQLLVRQEDELERLRAKQDAELDALEAVFAAEEAQFVDVFALRRERLRARWATVGDVERSKLGRERGVEFGPLPEIEWPVLEPQEEGGKLEVLDEGDD